MKNLADKNKKNDTTLNEHQKYKVAPIYAPSLQPYSINEKKNNKQQ